MKPIYTVNQKPYVYLPLPDVGRFPTNRRSEPAGKKNVSFKSQYSETPKNQNVVDLVTKKILITFFDYEDPPDRKKLNQEIRKFERLEQQINDELEVRPRFNEIF